MALNDRRHHLFMMMMRAWRRKVYYQLEPASALLQLTVGWRKKRCGQRKKKTADPRPRPLRLPICLTLIIIIIPFLLLWILRFSNPRFLVKKVKHCVVVHKTTFTRIHFD